MSDYVLIWITIKGGKENPLVPWLLPVLTVSLFHGLGSAFPHPLSALVPGLTQAICLPHLQETWWPLPAHSWLLKSCLSLKTPVLPSSGQRPLSPSFLSGWDGLDLLVLPVVKQQSPLRMARLPGWQPQVKPWDCLSLARWPSSIVKSRVCSTRGSMTPVPLQPPLPVMEQKVLTLPGQRPPRAQQASSDKWLLCGSLPQPRHCGEGHCVSSSVLAGGGKDLLPALLGTRSLFCISGVLCGSASLRRDSRFRGPGKASCPASEDCLPRFGAADPHHWGNGFKGGARRAYLNGVSVKMPETGSKIWLKVASKTQGLCFSSNSITISKKASLPTLLPAPHGPGFISCGHRMAERTPSAQHPTSPGTQRHQAFRSHVRLWIHDRQELLVTVGGSDFCEIHGLYGEWWGPQQQSEHCLEGAGEKSARWAPSNVKDRGHTQDSISPSLGLF